MAAYPDCYQETLEALQQEGAKRGYHPIVLSINNVAGLLNKSVSTIYRKKSQIGFNDQETTSETTYQRLALYLCKSTKPRK